MTDKKFDTKRSLLGGPGFALDVAETPPARDAFQALEERKHEVFERIERHERECQQTEAELRRLVQLTPKPTAQLVAMRVKLDTLKSQIEGFRKDLANLELIAQRSGPVRTAAREAAADPSKWSAFTHELTTLAMERLTPSQLERLKAITTDVQPSAREQLAMNLVALASGTPFEDVFGPDVRDIGITVGYLSFPAMSGPIPVYPVIVVEFADAKGFKSELLDRLELEITEDGRYKLYLPGEEASPFAETDDPVDAESHEAFQRLAKHWGYWFLRVQGGLNQWDFQIIGNKVYTLKHPIEASLMVIEGTRRDAVRAAMLGSRHDKLSVTVESEKLCDRFEALVGKMPVQRRGLKYGPGVVHARVVQKNVKDMQASAQWVRLDEDKLESQLKKIMGGTFVSIVWEAVRTGVDFIQLMPQTEGNRGPDIWLRAKAGHRQPVGHVHKIQAFGQELPLEQFKAEHVESLREEDVASVRRFYQVRSEQLRQAKAARVETSTDTSATEVDKQTHEAIVQNFLRLCQVVRIAASGGDQNASQIWPLLRDAVIFEMPTAAYFTLYEEFFRYCVRSAKVDPDIPLDEHTAKQHKRVMDMIETGADAPFPEKLPFRSCFFAYGAGAHEPGSGLLETEMRKKNPNEPPSVGKLYGHLVTEKGVVVSFRYLESPAQDGLVFTFDRDPSSVKGEKWDRPHTMTPWIVNALVSYVNEHKKLVEQGKNGFGYQSLVKKTAKGLSMKPPIPPPFYVVYLKDEFVREQARQRAASIKRHIDWQHRWNVRGHDCLRFMRGPLPIDSELEQELLARKYKIFTVEQPDSELFMALAKRGVPPKGTDEWMAVLSYWRDPFVKGPSDKPLIESVRRSTKSWGES